ncbi:non-ribosomal peptide synthetase [Streptomyces pinistramenti]|uniref:non-ribosomal peptide synthetase n=1 Tax=Streptomyces pinistramenti TaxID=2884812 RepID=UPI001D069798|nr:amino acid adenylation domain-containing protein [Streptomyces pinistramenti]MCB5911888.1 amino acid adenylation domain-containing protein [Streptomyces pinistramenti]
MMKPTDDDREYWRTALAMGGFTAVPRWAPDPVTGAATHELPLPDDLVARLDRWADAHGVPLDAVLLAAHARVLAALSGEQEVTCGYLAADGGPALPCRISTAPGTWRDLVREAARTRTDVLAHRHHAVQDIAGELGLGTVLFETELDLSGDAGEPADGTVLRVSVVRRGARLTLRLRHRTEALDAESAARIAGYHLTALARLADGPDTAHGPQSLLSASERRFQLEGLAGPHRDLPDRRFHELFEERVRAHPDAVAAVHGDRQWTYRELNDRANRLGRALLAQGLAREGVVAVVTERNLDWTAAVLAVLKAGGVYLPIEPHFPADRIAAMLTRAECGLVLTEPGSTATLDQALATLPGTRTLRIDAALAAGHPAGDLGVEVAAGQLAYIYFTSGSTGEPKGAMCEHAGFLNHLYAKIGDLGIAEGHVVAQTAPQCFDISLWQLVSALLVGGRTHLVGQPVVLDVQRFVDTLADARITVLQVVPSYLEAVLTHLERHPRPLPDLRCVSVTGEALKKELAQRWFAARPGVRLVNAYGLTETSDDTNHEVMERAPEGDRIPLGPCVNNVHVYVVDEHLEPVPLGAPGQIVFSGVCVGRGYVNDPERTRLAFLEDPHRPGLRLYQGGDFGRWLPGGKLEFLGRRDAQVKIRGFRIEIGEIENALLRVPGVRDGAVVVAGGDSQGKHLVAFYCGPQTLETDALREHLGESLPAYMVPTSFHWQEQLPLTANSKIDKKTLAGLAARPAEPAEQHRPPRTSTERRLACAWAKALGVPEDGIGRQDHFFDRGGTSLAAVKLVIALDRAFSLKDLTRHPVLADLADLLDGRRERDRGLLHTLAEPAGEPRGHLVCFPYAGGNAISFRPMAEALRKAGFALHAVELPGHDLAADREPFAPLEQVAEQAAAEITRRGLTGILLWGHSAGAAFAVATARLLHARQVPVQRVFIGAQLLGEAAGRRAAADALAARSAAEIGAELVADGDGPARGAQDARRAAHTGAAYRHDCVAAHHYFADILDHPPTPKLTAPLTLVIADDDPITAGPGEPHHDWRRLAAHVDLHRLPDGGHHFPRTRPAAAAQAVLHSAAAPTPT